MRNERALGRAFTDVASLGDQAFFLCADINMTEAVSIGEALMTETWIDVGTRYTTEDEAEPTYAGFKNWDKRSRGRKVTRPDRILANKLPMEMIKSFQIVRESTLPGHLPLKLTLNTAPLKQRIRSQFQLKKLKKQPKKRAVKKHQNWRTKKRRNRTSTARRARRSGVELGLNSSRKLP